MAISGRYAVSGFQIACGIAMLIIRTQGCCPYFDTPEWKAKKDKFTERDQIKNASCGQVIDGRRYEPDEPNKCPNCTKCTQGGAVLQYWCASECAANCPHANHSSRIMCVGTCDPVDQKPIVTCACGSGCNTNATKWTVLEETYEKLCLTGLNASSTMTTTVISNSSSTPAATTNIVSSAGDACKELDCCPYFQYMNCDGANAKFCEQGGMTMKVICGGFCSGKSCAARGSAKASRVTLVSVKCLEETDAMVSCTCENSCIYAAPWSAWEARYERDCLKQTIIA